MARLQIATTHVDADLAVFDKDGTLIDFHGVWGPRGIRAVAALGDQVDAALREAGMCLGVLTTDDREATLMTLAALALSEHVSHVVCGDDPGIAKPAPDGILQIAAASGISPQRSVMVGDTVANMRTGRAAGCFCVGVTSGAGDAEQLLEFAHVVVESVHDIHVLHED